MTPVIRLALFPKEAEKYQRQSAYEKTAKNIIFTRNLLYIEVAVVIIELLAIARHVSDLERTSTQSSCYSEMAPWAVTFVATNALIATTAKELNNQAQKLLSLYRSSVQLVVDV